MARNIGIAFGVVVLSQVYLFHVNTTIPASLVASQAAADQFHVLGQGQVAWGSKAGLWRAFN